MAEAYDGEIVLSMKVTPEEVKKSSQELSGEVKKIFEVGANTSLDKKSKELLTTLDKLNNKVIDAGKNLDEALNKQVPTAEYQELARAEADAEKELDKLVRKHQALVDKNSIRPVTVKYQELSDKLKEQGKLVEELTAKYGPYYRKVIEAQQAYTATELELNKIKPQVEAMYEAEGLVTERVEQQKEAVQSVKDEMDKLVKSGRAFTMDYEAITKAKNEGANLNNQLKIANEQSKEYLNNLIQQQNQERVVNNLKVAQQKSDQYLIENAKVENQEIAEKSRRLQMIQGNLDALKARQEQLTRLGIGPGTQQFREVTQEIVRTEQEYGKLKAEIDSYVQKLQTLPVKSKGVIDSFKQIPRMLKDVFRQLPTITKSAIDNVVNTVSKIPDVVAKGVKSFGKLSTAILYNIPGVKRFSTSILNLSKNLLGLGKDADKAGFNFKKAFMTILKYGLGIRGLFVLFRKLRSAVVEGVNNLVQTQGGMNATNQAMSQLMSSLNALKNAWGAAFAPILQVVAPILAKFIDMLTQFANRVAMFTSALIGKTTAVVAKKLPADYAQSLDKSGTASGRSQQEKYDKAVKKAQDKYDKQMESVTEKRAKAQAKAEEKQAKAAEKLAKKQEKANQQLGAYDKLNVIAKEDAEELTDIQATQYEDPELEMPNLEDYMQGMTDFDAMFEEVPIESAIKDLIDRIKEAWESGDFTEIGHMIGEKLKSLSDELTQWLVNVAQPMGEKIGKALGTFINGLTEVEGLANSLGTTFGEGVNTITYSINSFYDSVDWEQLGTFFGEGMNGAVNAIDWEALGHMLIMKWNAVFETLQGFVDTFDFKELGNSIIDAIVTMIEDFDASAFAGSLSGLIAGIFETIAGFFEGTDWIQLGETIFQKAIDLVNGIEWERLFDAVFEALGAALGGVSALLGTLLYKVGELLVEAWNNMVDWFLENAVDESGQFTIEGFLNGIIEALKNIGQWIVDHIFKPFIDGFKKAFGINSPSKVMEDEGGLLMDGLKQGVKDKIESIKKIFTDLKNKIVSVFNSLKTTVISVWNSMWSGIKGVINSILGGVEKMANGVIRGLNKMISAVNNISFDIPDWVPEIGGNTLGFHIPELSTISIPRLAQGAVIPPNKEFLAMLGDQNKGTNIEAPLDTIVEAVNRVLDEREGVSNHEPIVLQLDSKTIAEVVWDEEEKRYKQRGSSFSPTFA